MTITSVFNAKLQAKESTKVGIPAIAKITSLIILLAILGYFFGLEGLSIAVLISSIIETILLFFLYIKQSKT